MGGAGFGGYNIANADVSSGDRSVLVPVDPCRLADTRAGDENVGPRSTPLGSTETHSFDADQTGVPCTGSIPTGATALLLNVTAVGATAPSYLTFWAGGEQPKVASLNPTPGQPPAPNAVTVGLSGSQTFEVYNNAGSVDIVIDVVGYYESHDHDDRYYTKAQVEAVSQERVDAGTAGFLTAAQIGAVVQERIDASEPTEFRIEPSDFTIDTLSEDRLSGAVGWSPQATVFRVAGTVKSECIRAKVPLQPGQTVTDISIRYTSPPSAGALAVTLFGLETEPGPVDFGGDGYHVLASEQDLAYPATGGGVIGDLDVPLTGTATAVDGHFHQIELCTDDASLAIFAVVIDIT